MLLPEVAHINVLLVDDHPAVRFGIRADRRLAAGRQYFPAIPDAVTAGLCARLEPIDHAVCSMLIHGVPPPDIEERLGLASLELEARRGSILQAIAPQTARTRIVDAARAPLDYDRPRRRLRYSAPT
jgi:DNA-binding NarL/FixJ family response regulator